MEPRPPTKVDLARLLDSDAPTVTRSIHRLERAGFVRRRPNSEDRRSVIVEATTASTALRRSVERVWGELEALTVRDMTPDEQGAVLSCLNELETNLLTTESLEDFRE